MESTGKIKTISKDIISDKWLITIEADDVNQVDIEKLALADKLAIAIKKWHKKRSLDSNAYMWVLIYKMAKKLNSTPKEVYEELITTYGVFTWLPIPTNELEKIKAVYRVVIEHDTSLMTTPKGKQIEFVQCQCFKGSSLYDSKEMSDLLNGVVDEAKNLGIDTITPQELAEMNERYHIEKHNTNK